MRIRVLCLLLVMLLLTACRGGETAQSPVFHELENPAQLSAWNLLQIKGGTLTLGERVTPYDLNTPLFTDYAHKLRTVWLPDGTVARYQENAAFEFPVGTILSKTFYYPIPNGGSSSQSNIVQTDDGTAALLNTGFELDGVKLIETRLLVHRKDGWVALPYVWEDDQSDAVLKRVGDIKKLNLLRRDGVTESFAYVVPNANQCAGCHATNATSRALMPIGPKARHLNKSYAYQDGSKNQIIAWKDQGLLQGVPENVSPRNAVWSDIQAPLNARARAYLDINCSHCHNPKGPADTSGLYLEPDTASGVNLGMCKLPIAAGTGTGGHKYDIVPGNPAASIFSYRMRSTNPAEMMPELGRSMDHEEGVALINAWIAQMDGGCE